MIYLIILKEAGRISINVRRAGDAVAGWRWPVKILWRTKGFTHADSVRGLGWKAEADADADKPDRTSFDEMLDRIGPALSSAVAIESTPMPPNPLLKLLKDDARPD